MLEIVSEKVFKVGFSFMFYASISFPLNVAETESLKSSMCAKVE